MRGQEAVVNLPIEVTELPETPPLAAQGEGEVVCGGKEGR